MSVQNKFKILSRKKNFLLVDYILIVWDASRISRNLEQGLYRDRIRPPILFCILSDPRCHPVNPIYRVCRPGSTALARHLWTPCRGICRWLAADSSLAFRFLCVSAPFRILPPDRVDLSRKGTRTWARSACMCTRASLIGMAVVKHFDFVRFVAIVWRLICAHRFSRMILTWPMRDLKITYILR